MFARLFRQNYTMEQCNDIAHDLAKSIAQDGVPTFYTVMRLHLPIEPYCLP